MSKPYDWKQAHADEADRALSHALVRDVVAELMDNLNTTSPLVRYGILKVASHAAQVARAQALDIDPDLLRLSSTEATSEQVRMAAEAVYLGVPTYLVPPEDEDWDRPVIEP